MYLETAEAIRATPLPLSTARSPTSPPGSAYSGRYRCTTTRSLMLPSARILVRVHLIIEMSRPALHHGSLNSRTR
jgi:hypothetical protein